MLESHEAAVQKNGVACKTNIFQVISIGMVLWTAVATNVLVPFMQQEYMLAWLVLNDLLLCAVIVAAALTIITEPCHPTIKDRLKLGKPVIVDTRLDTAEDGHCYRCALDVQTRTEHCLLCQKCVLEFDHHCDILNACIGKANYKYFAVTLSATIAYVFNSFVICLATIGLVFHFDWQLFMLPNDEWVSGVIMGFTALLLLLPIACLSILGFWQIYARCNGYTQYEWFTAERRDERWDQMSTADGEYDVPELVVEALVNVSDVVVEMDINNNNPCVDKEVVKVNTEVVIELDINNIPCVHTKVVEVNTEVIVEMDIKNNPCADNIVFKLNVDDEVRKIEEYYAKINASRE